MFRQEWSQAFMETVPKISSMPGWQNALASACYQAETAHRRHSKQHRLDFLLCGEHKHPPFKMSIEPKKEASDKKNPEDVEVKMVPEGTFGGTREKPILVEKGEPIPEDTGDEGGGQN